MNIKRLLLSAALFCAFSPLWSQAKKPLVIYTWEEMFPQSILDSFERDNPDIQIVYETFETNEEMIEQLKFTSAAEHDLVIADDYILEFAIKERLARRLDKSKIGNLKNINPFYQHQFYYRYDEYTVPYGAGVQTIVYDPLKVNEQITSYADLWNSSLRGQVGITGNYRVMNGMALKARGKSYNTENLDDIREAGEQMRALAPNVRVIRDIGLEEELLSGNISVAVMYTDQVTKSKMSNSGLKEVFPREGIGFGIMAAFVPVNAPNADGAHRFLNYILNPGRGAQCFEYLGYYCTFKASERYIRKEWKDFLVLRESHFGNFEMIENLIPEAEEEHSRIWAEFNAAAGN